MRFRNLVRIAAHGGLLQRIAQLANIAAPALRGQQSQRIWAQLGRLRAAAQGHVFAQHLHQGRNVLAPVTQGRHPYGQHVQAVKKVFAEQAFTHQTRQVTRGRGNHACVKRQKLVGAQRFNFAFLQSPQQLGLQGQRHVANFVQKQSTAMGQAEFAFAALLLGAGIGTWGHAKKLSLQQGVGHRSDVQADERPIGTHRGGVDSMRQQFFARTGFAQQQHRAGRLRSAPGLALDLDRRRAGTDKAGKGVARLARVAALLFTLAHALGGQFTPSVIQVALQQGKLAHQRLQTGFGVVKKHNAQGANDFASAVAQGDAAHHKRAGQIGQKVNENGFAGFEHVVHLGVLNHAGHRVANKILYPVKTERG